MKTAKFVIEVPEQFAGIVEDSDCLLQSNDGEYSLTIPVSPVEIDSYVAAEDVKDLANEFVASAADEDEAVTEIDVAIEPSEAEGDTNEITKGGYEVNATEFRKKAEGRN